MVKCQHMLGCDPVPGLIGEKSWGGRREFGMKRWKLCPGAIAFLPPEPTGKGGCQELGGGAHGLFQAHKIGNSSLWPEPEGLLGRLLRVCQSDAWFRQGGGKRSAICSLSSGLELLPVSFAWCSGDFWALQTGATRRWLRSQTNLGPEEASSAPGASPEPLLVCVEGGGGTGRVQCAECNGGDWGWGWGAVPGALTAPAE